MSVQPPSRAASSHPPDAAHDQEARAAWATFGLPPRFEQWLRRGLVVASGGVVVGWLFLAVVHLGDRYRVGHGQGVWIALAHHFNTEGLYPPLYDGTHYGGVRYMPLPFVAHGLLARLTDEYLTSGKLLGLVATFALLTLVFVTLRRSETPPTIAFGLTAAVIAGGAGLLGGTTIGGDVLPVLFQVGALALVLEDRKGGLLGAAALCALAVLSRFNALWAPLAVTVWLWSSHRRRQAWTFLGAFVALSAVSLAMVNAVSDGRMLENVVGSATAGINRPAEAVTAPLRFLDNIVEGAPSMWALIPVVAFGALLARRSPRTNLFLIALLFSVAILLVSYADIGTGPNQLIDLIVLLALFLGATAAVSGRVTLGQRIFAPILVLSLTWVTFTGLVVLMRPDLKEAIGIARGADSPYDPDPLREHLTAGMTILSEDPGVAALRGETPVVFDPFMIRRIADRKPELVDDLVRRIEAQEFDRLVLVVPLENDEIWWRDYHFGEELVSAMRASYAVEATVAGYHLYRPSG